MKKRSTTLKDLFGGNKGSIELCALFLFFALFTLCLFINQRLNLWDKEIKQRARSLTCFKKIMDSHEGVLKSINLTNKAITAANATFLLTQNPISLQIKKATQLAQNFFIAKYLSQMTFEKSCRISQKLILSRFSPLFFPIKRHLSGTIRLKKKRWLLILPITFYPAPLAFLRGYVSTERKFEFSAAKEWSHI